MNVSWWGGYGLSPRWVFAWECYWQRRAQARAARLRRESRRESQARFAAYVAVHAFAYDVRRIVARWALRHAGKDTRTLRWRVVWLLAGIVGVPADLIVLATVWRINWAS